MTPPLVISVLQALDLAALVTDAAGHDICETARLSRLLAEDADSYDVRAMLLQLARKRLTRNGDSAPVAVETRRGTYTLLAVPWPEPDGTVTLGIGLATVSGNLAVDPSVSGSGLDSPHAKAISRHASATTIPRSSPAMRP